MGQLKSWRSLALYSIVRKEVIFLRTTVRRCAVGLTLECVLFCAESFIERLWYEENAHIPGCFQGDGKEGGAVGEQNSLASPGWTACRQRGFHEFFNGQNRGVQSLSLTLVFQSFNWSDSHFPMVLADRFSFWTLVSMCIYAYVCLLSPWPSFTSSH